MAHAARACPVPGLELVPDPAVQETSSGCRVVHLHQHYRGVPVFQAGCTVQLEADGALLNVLDGTWSPGADLEVVPAVGAGAAARAAAAYVADHGAGKRASLARFKSRVLGTFAHPSRPTVLHPGPFAEPITAHLVFFPMGRRVRLAWCLTVTLPDGGGEYDFLVAADRSGTPEILYCRSILASVRALGHIFAPFPAPPAVQAQSFPLPLGNLPSFVRPLPGGFPAEWVDGDSLLGNCTSAFLGNGKKSIRGTPVGGVVTFRPASPGGDEQKLVNAFFYCNVMHDFFLALGFDEAAGNFQNVNRTGAGVGGDCVEARIFNAAINGHATMRSRPDGKNGEMRLGIMPGSNRHTALDPDIVIHEFTHGVTERMVGGPMNFRALENPQSVALAEGWSDYFALTFQSYGQAEKVVFGDWVTQSPTGMRSAPYDDTFTRGFGDLGKGIYRDPATCGEVWCATLMRMNREIGRALGDARRGHEIGWQIVFDGLKLVRPNPNFLQARDAVYEAMDGLRKAGILSAAVHGAAAPAARQAFARHGMGSGARANDASLNGNVAG